MENKNFCESLDPVERESFLEKLNDCNDIEYLKQVIEVCRSKAICLALKKRRPYLTFLDLKITTIERRNYESK